MLTFYIIGVRVQCDVPKDAGYKGPLYILYKQLYKRLHLETTTCEYLHNNWLFLPYVEMLLLMLSLKAIFSYLICSLHLTLTFLVVIPNERERVFVLLLYFNLLSSNLVHMCHSCSLTACYLFILVWLQCDQFWLQEVTGAAVFFNLWLFPPISTLYPKLS